MTSMIVEFKAGKMDWDGKMVTPDKRKGKLGLLKDSEDLHHVVWTDRDKNEKIDDLVVVQDAYLERVSKCTTGRVYVLKYLSSKIRLFFWMQEPKDDKDEELIKKFNDAIGADIPPPKPAAGGATGATSTGAAGSNQALQEQLLAMLQNGANAPVSQRGPSVSLNHMLKSEVLLSLAEDAEALAELKSHMPKEQQADQDVIDTLRSPQLKQNMAVLSQAIHSDQLPTLMTMLGLPAVIQPGQDPMEALCKALEQKHKR